MNSDNEKVYSVRFTKKSLKDLNRLDVQTKKRIVDWIIENLDNSLDPRAKGKILSGNLKTYWRYRVGKYRVVVKIIDKECIIEIINAEKRNDVYKK